MSAKWFLTLSLGLCLSFTSLHLLAASDTGSMPEATTTTEAASEPLTVFRNVKVFNGRDPQLSETMDVWIKGEFIEKMEPHQPNVSLDNTVKIIEGDGRVLMPGLIDAHTHVMVGSLTFGQALASSDWYLGAVMKNTLESMLLRGFTTIRDMGVGADGSIAKAVDDGVILGPRVFPSAMSISQTGGHGDMRPPYSPNPTLDNTPYFRSPKRATILVDGAPQVLAAVRENLKAGATQIKIHAGGGATSTYDPLFTVQFTADEIKAAVEAADNWGTYVVAHAYNDKSIQKLVENGVEQIAHGHLMSEDTVKMLAEKKVIVQPDFVWLWADMTFAKESGFTELNLRKVRQIHAEAPNYVALLKQYNIKTVFGTDLTDPFIHHQNKELSLRTEYWEPADVLIQATGNAYDAISMSGPLNTYGKFGVIEPEARADILLVKGNPMEDITVLEKPDENLLVIMKDGKFYKEVL